MHPTTATEGKYMTCRRCGEGTPRLTRDQIHRPRCDREVTGPRRRQAKRPAYVGTEGALPMNATKPAEVDTPAEVWCRHCDRPSTETVDGEAYCHDCALTQNYRLHSTSWNPSRETKKGRAR